MAYAIIGNGGREHAIAWKLAQTVPQDQIFVLSGNAGIPNSHNLDVFNFDLLKTFCEQHDIQTIIAGSEAVLVAGIYDYFKNSSIKVFGASQAAAQLEGSKIFSKLFMKKYGVKTANFVVYGENIDDSSKNIDDFAKNKNVFNFVMNRNGNIVVKYDGLAAGKGVFVCDSIQEYNEALEELSKNHKNNMRFIVEDKLIGDELSIICFTDGKTVKLLLPSQDHKQVFDGDKGANTGGMGAYCPVHWCDANLIAEIWKDVIQPTLNGIQKENFDYKGFIYFGIMLTNEGAFNLEYNVRLGDPEAEVLMPSLKTDLVSIIDACMNETLDTVQLEFHNGYFIDVVQTSGGYPKDFNKGYNIEGIENLDKNTLIFYSGVSSKDKKLVTNGGRVLNVVCNAPTLDEAIKLVYAESEKIVFKDKHIRKDIAQRPKKI